MDSKKDRLLPVSRIVMRSRFVERQKNSEGRSQGEEKESVYIVGIRVYLACESSYGYRGTLYRTKYMCLKGSSRDPIGAQLAHSADPSSTNAFNIDQLWMRILIHSIRQGLPHPLVWLIMNEKENN